MLGDRRRLVGAIELREGAGALELEGRDIGLGGLRSEELLPLAGELERRIGVAGLELDEREQMMGAGELEPVLARLEQDDRGRGLAAGVVALPAKRVHARQRPSD